jgi:hypothetical protein
VRNLIPALAPVTTSDRPLSASDANRALADELRAAGQGTSRAESIAVWGPILAAMLLDVADLFSLGPQGLVIGMLAGTTLGYRIAVASGFAAKGRLACAALGALYCFLPLTELLPLATMLTTASRVLAAISLLRRR